MADLYCSRIMRARPSVWHVNCSSLLPHNQCRLKPPPWTFPSAARKRNEGNVRNPKLFRMAFQVYLHNKRLFFATKLSRFVFLSHSSYFRNKCQRLGNERPYVGINVFEVTLDSAYYGASTATADTTIILMGHNESCNKKRKHFLPLLDSFFIDAS